MMGFGAAVKSCLTKYFTFAGRAPRAEYWFFTLFTILVSVVASGLDSLLFSTPFEDGGPIDGITSLALILPGVTVLVRRFHDIGKPGWHAALVLVGLFLGGFSSVFASASGNNAGLVLGLVVLVGSLGWLLYGTLKGSEPGTNVHGPNPYDDPGRSLEEVFE